MSGLKAFFWSTDLGFMAYWLITALHLIPAQYLFQDYTNPILTAWNWSFLPLDIWRSFAFISLVLTFNSGLNAIAFWVIRRDFDPSWWIPNLYLMIYPPFFLQRFVKLEVRS